MSDLLIEKRGGVAFATLNRPETLNALNFPIIRGLNALLDDVEADSSIRAVCITGAGERAFCAGGDIKAAREGGLAWKAGKVAFDDVLQFFDEEYALNRRMFRFAKPLIALMNGITMGGGVGIAGACRFRLATEKILWAMPEVSIGFFPDVGAGYYLTGAPGHAGRYLGLTGQPVSNLSDLIACGFVTNYLPTARVDEFLAQLAVHEDIPEIIHSLSETPMAPPGLNYEAIDFHFAFDTVEEILASLDTGDEWAKSVAALMRTKSPASLKITLRHLQLSAEDTFDNVSLRDVKLAESFLRGHDLYEGIRAAVVDKDRNPKWSPSGLHEITPEFLADYF